MLFFSKKCTKVKKGAFMFEENLGSGTTVYNHVRVSGGRNFADAMVRMNVSTKDYISLTLKAIHIRFKIDVESIQVILGDEDFTLIDGKIVLMHETYEYVEQCRRKGAFIFEEILLSERLV
jgi:hypothetical protein